MIKQDNSRLTPNHCAICGGDRKHHKMHFTGRPPGTHRFVAAIKR